MSHKAQRAALVVMAKMALSDGHISEEERQFLAEHAEDDSLIDALVEEARSKHVSELVRPIERYADKFFVALRAASMASIDQHLDAREEAFFESLVEHLGLTAEDRELINQSVAALDQASPPPLDPRLEELYRQSSFA